MEATMNETCPKFEQRSSARAEIKSVLLRLVVFTLVLFITHFLALWLHPLGAHRFFWNLALGSLTFGLGTSLLWSRIKGKFSEAENDPHVHH